MEEDKFKRVIGRTMEALEIAGIENKALKSQIKGFMWDLYDDLNEESMKEGVINGICKNTD